MRNTKSAFTLVELIVVITILAILGTIAFISLQGYSADARNSKRTSDLGNIQSAVSLKQVEWVPLMSFIDPSTQAMTNIALWGVALANAATAYPTQYAWWKPAYTVLNVVEKDFRDPQDKDYSMAATTKAGWAFQISATVEVDNVKTALINGNFNSRLNSVTAGGTGSIIINDADTFTLGDTYANMLKPNDVITFSSGWNLVGAVIKKVSRDWVTVTLKTGYTATWEVVWLTAAESLGLIMGNNPTAATTTGAVQQDDTNATTTSGYLPY